MYSELTYSFSFVIGCRPITNNNYIDFLLSWLRIIGTLLVKARMFTSL
jgi:hypothetical protein